MPYEVRVKGEVVGRYARQRDAHARVKALVAADPDADPEIVRAETGQAAEPAATKAEREDYATKVGF